MPESDEIARLLRERGERATVRVGATLSDSAEAMLSDLISAAAGRLGALSESQQHIARAEGGIDQLLFRAAYHQYPGARPEVERKAFDETRGRRTVTERDLRAVLDSLCPGFWPFC